jgi:hypothetical protein
MLTILAESDALKEHNNEVGHILVKDGGKNNFLIILLKFFIFFLIICIEVQYYSHMVTGTQNSYKSLGIYLLNKQSKALLSQEEDEVIYCSK